MNDDWLERWREGRIGWHESAGNRSLQKHWNATGKRLLVPLCGKSRDLVWLEKQGNKVVGVELSGIAAEAFFEENGIAFARIEGEFTSYVAEDRAITIHCGDFFKFAEGPFDGYYDRGALVAIAPDRREAYVRHAQSLLAADAAKLIITVEYDQSIAAGPPFSIPAAAMHRWWPELNRVDAYDDIDNGPPKFREAGLREMIEVIWRHP